MDENRWPYVLLLLGLFGISVFIAWKGWQRIAFWQAHETTRSNEGAARAAQLAQLEVRLQGLPGKRVGDLLDGQIAVLTGTLRPVRPLQDTAFGVRRDALLLTRVVSHWGERVRHVDRKVTDPVRNLGRGPAPGHDSVMSSSGGARIERERVSELGWQGDTPRRIRVTSETLIPSGLHWTEEPWPRPVVEPMQQQVIEASLDGVPLAPRFVDNLVRRSEDRLVGVPMRRDTFALLDPRLQAHYQLDGGNLLRPYLSYPDRDPKQRGIGDERVAFSELPSGEVTLIAQYSGGRLEPTEEFGAPIAFGTQESIALFREWEPAPTYTQTPWRRDFQTEPVATAWRFVDRYRLPLSMILGGGLTAILLLAALIRMRN